MEIVLITAFGVGLSTVIGGIFGFSIKNIPYRFNDAILSVAAGVMLTAAIVGLILPAIEEGGQFGLLIAFAGIMAGALFLNFANRFAPHLCNLSGLTLTDDEKHKEKVHKVLLFIMAITIHNFPEGIAAGVGFGTGDIGNALSVALGIALQNIPEGMVMITPMLSIGISKKRAFLITLFTGMVEVVGTMFGYFAVSFATAILPFALAFAGGTMIYIIVDDMIPETHSGGSPKLASYSFLIGFIIMLAFNYLIN